MADFHCHYACAAFPNCGCHVRGLNPPQTPVDNPDAARLKPDQDPNFRLSFGSEAHVAVEELRVLIGNVSASEVLRRAIGTELLLRRQMAKGWRVLLNKRGKYREVEFGDS